MTVETYNSAAARPEHVAAQSGEAPSFAGKVD